MSTKTLNITDSLYDYWLKHGVKESDVMAALRAETQMMPTAIMQISPEQGQFMHFLTKLLGAKDALEIGTFTGYSALAVASALPDNGLLVACDQSEEWTAIAQKYWAQAGLADKIQLRLAPALDTLTQLIKEKAQFDLIFIDADKITYNEYYERSMLLLRPRGLLLLDNMFFGGDVADPHNNLPATRAIRALNTRLANDPGVDYCLLSIGDGLGLVRKA